MPAIDTKYAYQFVSLGWLWALDCGHKAVVIQHQVSYVDYST